MGDQGDRQWAKHFCTGSEDDGIPLYLCLGSPSHTESPSNLHSPPTSSYLQLQDQPSRSTVYVMDLDGIPDKDAEDDTEEDIWEKENLEDPYTAERLQH